VFRKDPDHLYRAEPLAALPWLEHGFGTRLSEGWHAGRRTALLTQVHSALALVAERDGLIGEADALISNQPCLLLGVRTADCAPIILADPVHRSVAVIHAGWRGAAGEIVARTIQLLEETYRTQAAHLTAAIGPTIGECCYEVGPEVASRFERWFPERDDLDQRTRLDLEEALYRQLVEAAVPPQHISRSGLCTRCGEEEFYSYRRQGKAAGRMVSGVAIWP